MYQHTLTQTLSNPSQCATSLLKHRIPSLTIGELLTKVVNCKFFLPSLILLTKNTTHTFIKHSQIHDQWSSFNRWRQNRRLKQIFFDTIKSFLAVFGPITRLIFPKKLEYRCTCGSHVGNESGNIIQAAGQTSNLLLSFWRRHLLYFFDLGMINLNTLLAKINPNNLSERTPNVHLLGFKRSLYFLKCWNSFNKCSTCSSSSMI